MMAGRKTLEINYKHPVIVDMLEKVKADKNDNKAKESAVVLFQAALLESGYEISDPSALVKRVFGFMSKELGVDENAPLKEIELPEEEEPEEKEEEPEEEVKADEKKDDADEE